MSPFPVPRQTLLKTPALLAERGFFLRAARQDDLAALVRLYADTRADELAGIPWPDEAKQAFLAQQFSLQHEHYLRHHPDAQFLVLEHDGVVQGRFYLEQAAPEHLVVDICLLSAWHGQGFGRALMLAALAEAAERGHGMGLHVLQTNPRARALYERLGFEICDETSTHQRMRWVPAPRGDTPSVS